MYSQTMSRLSLLSSDHIRWRILAPFIVIHLAALLAFVPSLFSWTGLLLVPIGNYVFGSLGINLCYHRLLTHKSLELPKKLEHFLAVLGLLSLQNTPIVWVAIHRLHHRTSDQDRDPHSPKYGLWWSHFQWMFTKDNDIDENTFRLCPDLIRDRFYKRLEKKNTTLKFFMFQLAIFAAVPFIYELAATGSLKAAALFSASIVVWGVFVRQVYVWHVTFAVNSFAHRFGYRNYDTPDGSRNNWLVALCTNGEGWHNNHHADQRSARTGHRWWELDLTYWTIALLAYLGIAKRVVQPQKSAAAS